jgi:hypothetical protein
VAAAKLPVLAGVDNEKVGGRLLILDYAARIGVKISNYMI